MGYVVCIADPGLGLVPVAAFDDERTAEGYSDGLCGLATVVAVPLVGRPR